MVALRKGWIGTRGAPEAAAWRSNAWLACAAIHFEFSSAVCESVFSCNGSGRDWKAAFAAHRETSRSGVRSDLRESAAFARLGRTEENAQDDASDELGSGCRSGHGNTGSPGRNPLCSGVVQCE